MRRWMQLQVVAFVAVVCTLSLSAMYRARSVQLPVAAEVWRGQAAQALEHQIDERFPLRRLGINVWAAIDWLLFHEGRPGVVAGRDGWLYTDEEFKVDTDAAAIATQNLGLVEWVHAQLRRDGVALVVAVVPAKTRIYPEYLRRQPPPLQRALYTTIRDALHQDGIDAPDLRAALSVAKTHGATYLRTDTHWTAFGAASAAAQIAHNLRAHDAEVLPPAAADYLTQHDGDETYRGDLVSFLPFDPYFSELLPPLERIPRWRTLAQSPSSGGDADDADDADALFGDAAAAAVVLLGTSYSANAHWNFLGALRQALSTDVVSYAREGVGPFVPMLDYLHGEDYARAKPRVVIWELPERYVIARQTLSAYHLPAEATAMLTPPPRFP